MLGFESLVKFHESYILIVSLIFLYQPPQAQQAPLQIQPSIISQQAVAAAAAAAQQQYAAVPVSMVETGRQMLLTVH